MLFVRVSGIVSQKKRLLKWLAAQSRVPKEAQDPIADALVSALAHLQHDKGFRLGRRGYVVRRAKGRGASGLVAYKVT